MSGVFRCHRDELFCVGSGDGMSWQCVAPMTTLKINGWVSTHNYGLCCLKTTNRSIYDKVLTLREDLFKINVVFL